MRWGKNGKERQRKFVNKTIFNKRSVISFILDVLVGMGIALVIVLLVSVIVIVINDLVRGSIPLASLVNTIEWIISK